MKSKLNDNGSCQFCGSTDWFFLDLFEFNKTEKQFSDEPIKICKYCVMDAYKKITNTKKCPICKSLGFETTQYKKEGGFCWKCNIWIVNQSSAKDIFRVRGNEKLSIQFHRNGIPTYTWKEWCNKFKKDAEVSEFSKRKCACKKNCTCPYSNEDDE